MNPILKRHYDLFLNAPNMPPSTAATTTLACGYNAGKPFIVEVSHDGLLTHYESQGAHAVGSGGAFAAVATALLSHFQLTERPLRHGLLAAWRVLNIVIETSAQGVGHPIQLWSMTPDEAPRKLGADELTELENVVGGWQEPEVEALDRVTGAKPDVPEPLPDPMSEDITDRAD